MSRVIRVVVEKVQFVTRLEWRVQSWKPPYKYLRPIPTLVAEYTISQILYIPLRESARKIMKTSNGGHFEAVRNIEKLIRTKVFARGLV